MSIFDLSDPKYLTQAYPIPPCDLVAAIMSGQSITRDEAEELFQDSVAEVDAGADPEEVLEDLGLEPDYIFDLLGGML